MKKNKKILLITSIQHSINPLLHYVIVVLLSNSLLLMSCRSTERAKVVVVAKTKSYHTQNCPRVNMADARLMTRDEAVAMNCKPCPGCKPDNER